MRASIIVAVISILGSFALVYLSVIKEQFDAKNKVRREQLDNFYIPFYQKYCAGFLSETHLSSANLDSRSIFLDLFTQNIHLMEPLSQSMYQNFYSAFLDLLEAENNNPDFPYDECCEKFDEAFNSLSKAVLTEYTHILKKCHLPVPLLKGLLD